MTEAKLAGNGGMRSGCILGFGEWIHSEEEQPGMMVVDAEEELSWVIAVGCACSRTERVKVARLQAGRSWKVWGSCMRLRVANVVLVVRNEGGAGGETRRWRHCDFGRWAPGLG